MISYKVLTSLADKLLPPPISSSLRGVIRARRVRRNCAELESRRLTWDAQVGKEQPLLIEIQPRVTIAAYSDSALCRLIYMGQYELAERQFVSRFLRPGDVFVDVGANIGLYSLQAATVVGTRGRVWAFEPCAQTHSRLIDNIARNRFDNVHAQRVALSDSNGTLAMTISTDGFDAWNSAGKPTMGSRLDGELVPCETWDSFAKRQRITGCVSMMKVDIEGWESYFLAGAAGELSASDSPTLLIELNEQAARSANSSVEQVRLQLKTLGYSLYTLNNDGLLIPLSDGLRLESQNAIALKNLDAVHERVAGAPSVKWMR
jgi:FkbM family methyltransferase